MGTKSEQRGFSTMYHIREWLFQDNDHLLMVRTPACLLFLENKKNSPVIIAMVFLFLKKAKRTIERSSLNPQWCSFLQVSVAGTGTGRGSPAVTLVQLPSGQTVPIQGVIQSPHIQTVRVSFLPTWFVFDFLELELLLLLFFFFYLFIIFSLCSFYAPVVLLEIWRNFLLHVKRILLC